MLIYMECDRLTGITQFNLELIDNRLSLNPMADLISINPLSIRDITMHCYR